MKTSIYVYLLDEIDKPHYELYYYTFADKNAELAIFTDKSKGISDLLSNKEDIYDALVEANDTYNDLNQYDEDMKFNTIDNLEDLLSNIVYVHFKASKAEFDYKYNCPNYDDDFADYTDEEEIEVIDEYLNNNPEYKEYPIVAPGYTKFDTDYEAIEDKYKEYKELYVHPEGEDEPISIDKAKVNTIDSVINDIKKLNLSPLETVILVYDLVKEKPYKEETYGVSKYDSRSTYNAILGDTIVCVGYSRIIADILSGLGFRVIMDKLNDENEKEGGHVRNAVYIDDPKYNVKGLYSLDATYDSALTLDNDDYLYKYRYFLKTPGTFNSIDEHEHLVDRSLGFFNDNTINEWENIYKYANTSLIESLGNHEEFKIRGRYTSTILNVLYLLFDINIRGYEENREEIVRILKEKENEIKELIGKPIPAHEMVKAIGTVRYVENQMDSEKYKIDYKALAACVLKGEFQLDEEHHMEFANDAMRLLNSIFGVSNKEYFDILDEEERKKMIIRNYCHEFYDYMDTLRGNTHKVVDGITLYSKTDKDIKL